MAETGRVVSNHGRRLRLASSLVMPSTLERKFAVFTRARPVARRCSVLVETIAAFRRNWPPENQSPCELHCGVLSWYRIMGRVDSRHHDDTPMESQTSSKCLIL